MTFRCILHTVNYEQHPINFFSKHYPFSEDYHCVIPYLEPPLFSVICHNFGHIASKYNVNMKIKTLLITICLTLISNILWVPLVTQYDFKSIVATLVNKNARVDIVLEADEINEEPFRMLSVTKYVFPEWGKKKRSQLAMVELPISNRKERHLIELQALKKGQLCIVFRGPDKREEGKRYPVVVDYENLEINGRNVFHGKKVAWYDKSFYEKLNVVEGEKINIGIDIVKHQFNWNDLELQKIKSLLWFILTGNIIVFLLFFLILSRLGKIGKKNTMFDFVFLSVFFFLLLVPMSHISEETISLQENRTLAVKPHLKDILEEKTEYGKKFEEWFNDHFRGRNSLVGLHSCVRNKFNRYIKNSRAVYFKDNGWMFLFPLVLDHKRAIAESCIQNFVKFDNFCKENKIKFYVLAVPRKQTIYYEYLTDFGYDKRQSDNLEQIYAEIKDATNNAGIPLIYPVEELKRGKQEDYVYYKWTHHWTEWGAYIGYQALMKEVKKDFATIHVAQLEDFNITKNSLIRDTWDEQYYPGGLEHFLHIDSRKIKDKPTYTYYDHKDLINLKVKVGKYMKDFSYSKGKYKIMLIGNSMNDILNRFLPYSAKELKYIKVNAGHANKIGIWKIMKLYKNEIVSFKPDILIFSTDVGAFSIMKQLFQE